MSYHRGYSSDVCHPDNLCNSLAVMRYKSSHKKPVDSLSLPCNKTIYHSKAEAEDMIRHISETRVTREIKAYRCSVCGFWHLTSKSD